MDRALSLLFLAGSLAGGAGCVGARDMSRPATGAPAVRADAAAARPARVLPEEDRRARLLFELRGRRFPLPLLHGQVGATPTYMLVDTGANSHVLAGWFARRLGLPMRKLGDLGTDHAGRPIATYIVETATVRVDGWGVIGDGPFLVADVPEALEAMGIGAFLSPQKLPREGRVVVLDLPKREVVEATPEAALAQVARRGRMIMPRSVRSCVDGDSSNIHGLAFVVPAKLDGQAVELLLDTGALRTDLLAGSEAGRGLMPRSVPGREALVAASGRIETRTVRRANLRIGDHTVTMDIDIVEGSADDACPRDGVVAMDVLQRCVLVLGATGAHGRCKP